MNSDNCCPQNIRMCTQDELRTGRFSNANTRCDPCALGPYGRPQICPMTGLPCPVATNENTCRAPDGKCITVCDGMNNSYYCHSTTRNCEGSPLPPDLSQNRFATKEECERVMKLCRRPGPRPIPPGPRPIPPGPRPIPPAPRSCRICKEDADGIVIDDDPNTCVRKHPTFDHLENCCCEAGLRCENQDNILACLPVWAKEKIAANSSCPPGYGWSSVGSQQRGLPCVDLSPSFQ